MKITIEVSEEERQFFCESCFLRVTKHAADLLENPEDDDKDDPDAPWTARELRAIGRVVESVRTKVVEAIHKASITA